MIDMPATGAFSRQNTLRALCVCMEKEVRIEIAYFEHVNQVAVRFLPFGQQA